MNENRTYVVNMFVRLLSLEFDGLLNIDYSQASKLLTNLELKPALANNLSWDIIVYNRIYCAGCGKVHVLPVGLPYFWTLPCASCVDTYGTLKHVIYKTMHPIAKSVDNLPVDLRIEIVNKFLYGREINGLQRSV